ncbi:hypothetical protein ACFFIX_23940 [Metabacillus herbersteinensis]|uniref:YkoP-like domain-containing protein n=1 Tax=Metabacillus herbersteinensis TaxID=283816 RepID=A0ABV6GL38_9BACI
MRSYILSFWNVLDPLYYLLTRLEYIDRHSGIFRVRLTKYKGRTVILSDGTLIKKNDKLVKIHLHNSRILSELQYVPCSVRRGRTIFKRIFKSMPTLAEYIHNHKNSNEIKGAIGITMLHKGAEKLGFEIIQPCNMFYRLFKSMSQFPIFLLSSGRPKTLKIPDTYYLFISKEKLLQTYQKLTEEDIKYRDQ